jgi:protein-S-isoprenylcysteine O-methyltransferase Ste14
MISILVVVQGYLTLKKRGGSLFRITESENFPFENTTNLVTQGIYRHIRHPMYSSLLYFSLGVLLKHITALGILLYLLVLIFLLATAKVEEQENLKIFGQEYEEYRKRTRMFIPHML